MNLRRILLKISGEGFCADGEHGVDPKAVRRQAEQLRAVKEAKIELAIVVGGGNIVRGSEFERQGMNRATADTMGMVATVINAQALQDALEQIEVPARVMTAVPMAQIAELYLRRRAIRHLEKGRIVLLAGGTGNPYFTTDTAAVLRAVELGADVLYKATKVDGVYSADPKKDPGAVRFDRISYLEVLNKKLGFMDSTAISLCMDHELPVLVFNMWVPGNLEKAIRGERVGTLVR